MILGQIDTPDTAPIYATFTGGITRTHRISVAPTKTRRVAPAAPPPDPVPPAHPSTVLQPGVKRAPAGNLKKTGNVKVAPLDNIKIEMEKPAVNLAARENIRSLKGGRPV